MALPKVRKQLVTKAKGTYFIETYGCQMNKYDSEIVAGILSSEGYTPGTSLETSDIVLVNTCSVRESAETRVRGRLNSIKTLKLQKKKVIIGVLGCMAERLGDEITHSHQFVDFVLGPDRYRVLPEILASLCNGGKAALDEVETLDEEVYYDVVPERVPGISAWIAIMRGCNNFCSYCVVPYVRGRERSRRADNIVTEAETLAREGFLEVTLLGQNVNSYWDGEYNFADLLERVAHVIGLRRVRFATSHPKDLTQKLIDTIAANDRICNQVHLPVQSGSDRILQLMNRGYTSSHYRSLISELRNAIPELTITTDIIVGFPGESEEEYAETKALVQEVEFDAAYIFKYSARQGTAAARLSESMSEAEKVARLEDLLLLQKRITLAKNRALVGQTAQVLVEGPSKKSNQQFMGRTEGNKIVVLTKDELAPGDLISVEIVGAEGHTLFGKVVQTADRLIFS